MLADMCGTFNMVARVARVCLPTTSLHAHKTKCGSYRTKPDHPSYFFKRVHVGARHFAILQVLPKEYKRLTKRDVPRVACKCCDYRHQEPYALHRDMHETFLRQDGDVSHRKNVKPVQGKNTTSSFCRGHN